MTTTNQPEIKPRGMRLVEWVPLKDGDVLEVLEGSTELYTRHGDTLVVNISSDYGPEVAYGCNGYDLMCRLKVRARKPKGIGAFIRKVESEYPRQPKEVQDVHKE
jgi:hypothetical protein